MSTPDHARSVRVTAALTALLGALLLFGSVGGHLLVRFVNESIHTSPIFSGVDLPPTWPFLTGFLARSLPWNAGLSLVFIIAGILALNRHADAPRVLGWAALVGMLGMVGLTAAWCLAAAGESEAWLFYLVGVVSHGIQILLIWRVWRYLGRDDVRAACRG